MTFNIPYSFVPGTKAKANEVNANFIAVINELDKISLNIETFNSELETLNSELETFNSELETKAEKNLTNLDEEGQSTLDNKADKTEIDGNWTSKNSYIAQNITISENFNKTYDLTSLLPKDDNVYEIIMGTILRTGTDQNNCLALTATTKLCSSTSIGRAVTRVHNYNSVAAGTCSLPIGKDRTITIKTGTETNASSYPNSCAFRLCAYRKVR